jgi:uncharacterized protein (TIRG00374 family)
MGAARPKGVARKKRLVQVIKLAVSVSLIGWLLGRTDLADIAYSMRSASLQLLILAYCLILVDNVISVSRWRVLLRSQEVQGSFPYLLSSYLVGAFFNNLLPSTIGGDAVRAYYACRIGASRGVALLVVLVERYLGLLALMLFAIGALVLSQEVSSKVSYLEFWLILAAVGMIGIGVIMFLPGRGLRRLAGREKLGPRWLQAPKSIVARLGRVLVTFSGSRVAVARALLLSIVLQLNVVIHYYVIGRALSFEVPLVAFFVVVPVALFVTMIPIAINGIGLRENIFVVLFAHLGVAEANAVALAWIAYGFLILQGLLGGAVYALQRK